MPTAMQRRSVSGPVLAPAASQKRNDDEPSRHACDAHERPTHAEDAAERVRRVPAGLERPRVHKRGEGKVRRVFFFGREVRLRERGGGGGVRGVRPSGGGRIIGGRGGGARGRWCAGDWVQECGVSESQECRCVGGRATSRAEAVGDRAMEPLQSCHCN
jgi:hypothetical protein